MSGGLEFSSALQQIRSRDPTTRVQALSMVSGYRDEVMREEREQS